EGIAELLILPGLPEAQLHAGDAPAVVGVNLHRLRGPARKRGDERVERDPLGLSEILAHNKGFLAEHMRLAGGAVGPGGLLPRRRKEDAPDGDAGQKARTRIEVDDDVELSVEIARQPPDPELMVDGGSAGGKRLCFLAYLGFLALEQGMLLEDGARRRYTDK